MKRTPEPHAKRAYCNEYYRKAEHMNPSTKGYAIDIWGARLGAVKHIILDHAEKVVCYKRSSGRVLWTRYKGPNGAILKFDGDLLPGETAE